MKTCRLPDLDRFPRHLGRAIGREWRQRRGAPLVLAQDQADPREAEANAWLRDLTRFMPRDALPLGACEMELVEFAKQRAFEADQLLSRGANMEQLERYCARYGVEPPAGKTNAGRAKRVACSLWWRRALRRANARRSEHLSIQLGLVHCRHGLYASHDAIARRREQKRRNRGLLEALAAINELGQEYTLQELADLSISNPAIRRAELMVRIAGFEHIAQGLDYAGEFITLTAPSRFHPRHKGSGQRNAKYNGATPIDTRDYLQTVWSRITAALARMGIKPFGFRVAEPHHDGTPHWHALLFMPKEAVTDFRRVVARHAVREDRQELGLTYLLTKTEAMQAARGLRANGAKGKLAEMANKLGIEADFWANPPRWVWKGIKPRVWFKPIDWSVGTAAGYLAKYVAKNIDGLKHNGQSIGDDFEAQDHAGVAGPDDGASKDQAAATDATVTAIRVDAWASHWGIRQFQQIGGPPVGVWRELRRWDYQAADAEDVLMHAAIAADTGNWGRFVHLMGGHEAKRAEMPLTTARDSQPAENRYGEPGQKRVFGVVEVASGQLAQTRVHEWQISRKAAGVEGSAASPWTRVNNSTFLSVPPQGEIQPEWQFSEADRVLVESQDDDSDLLTAEQLAARREYEAHQRYLRMFPEFVHEWAQRGIEAHQLAAERQREASRERVRMQKINRRLAANLGMTHRQGMEVLDAIRAQALGTDKPRRRQTRPRDERWSAGGPGIAVSQQLAQATARARQWINQAGRA
ncbi:replication endonuclease [Chromobacterium violaceum]|uniref:replication endonuclease n=1 Tax=Chromobacterium violaceum TaxID=536 RepID=UPI00143DAF22|nr:replication endonuclease [Chromobacterium violaceum]QIY78363.1 replication endonuclease [Chromobacterium violaceum]